jgi:all-trans-8'-apo-beta-carotenal 15,15'-oxygenase
MSFENGKIKFKTKFIQTQEYQDESQSNSILYRSTFNTQRPSNILFNTICLNNAFDLKIKNLANTNVIYWYKI